MSSTVHSLKTRFREVYPEFATQLEKAKSQEEVEQLQQKFLLEARTNLARLLNKPVEALEASDQTAPIILTEQQYSFLVNATGDTIMNQLHVLLDGTARLKSMEQDDAAAVTAQLIISGVLSLGGIAIAASRSALIVGAVEAAAAYMGVQVATVGLVCGIAAIVIVAILIPIIYFMKKPANCIVLVINELDQDLTFKGDYNVHGKPMLMTSPIPKAVVIPDVKTFRTAGFIATEKRENALVGTQYGFTMAYGNKDLSWGVECPLSSIYVDNNCYCGIGISAQTAAETTNSKNVQSWAETKDGITLSIKCNSGSGSIAYFIARAYKQ
jgi:hypothetical protein